MIPGRRFAAYGGMRRPSFRGAGGRVPGPLLALEDGTFSRSSTAWALDSDGILQEYAANELRTEYRSDLGLYLLEGERTNRVSHYRDATQWTVTGATTDSTSESDPAGGNNAGQFSGTTGDTIEAPLATQPGDSTTVSAAVWVRGTGTVRVRIRAKDGTFVNGSDVTLTSSYQRIDVQGSTLTGATNVLPGVEIRAAGTTVDIYGFQLEDGESPSSEIVTSGGAAVRAADSLTFPGSEVPEQMRSGKWAFDFYPYMTSDELISGGTIMRLFKWSNGAVTLRENGGIAQLRIRDKDSAVIQNHTLTWNDRHQKLTFTFDQAAGSLTIEGATTGNETRTPGTWEFDDGTTLDVGGDSFKTFGRISNVRKA